jgi:hypothetical protein
MEFGVNRRDDLAEVVADSRLDPGVFGWPD